MSQDQFGKTTRRAFLGTATVATAATLAAPVAGEAQTVDTGHLVGTTKLAQANTDVPVQLMSRAKAGDWTKPAAMAIPKEGYFKLETGTLRPNFPKTPANYGFTIIAKIKPGREEVIRAYGKTIEDAIAGDPFFSPHSGFTTSDGSSSTSAAIRISCTKGYSIPTSTNTPKTHPILNKPGHNTVFENLEGFPMDWKTNAPAFVKFVREHQCPSFLEYGEYPFVTADEIKKALKVKEGLSAMLDQMQ